MAWAKTEKTEAAEGNKYDAVYYRNLFQKKRENLAPIRMALVGKENVAKTGLACDIALKHTDKDIVILDCDNSASNTVDYLKSTGATNNIRVIPLIDELDESIWNEDNSTNWVAVVDKLTWFVNLIGEESDNIGAVIFDGGSTFMKWCEFVMTDHLMNRSKNPINVDDGDRFNQAEWRTRNKLFKDVINRLTALPVPYMFFTFHMKDQRQYMDIGDGTKALMKIGEKVDWVDGTQRFVSQQIFLKRYTQKGDKAAGVEADKSLKEGDWIVRGTVEEMKGRNMEHLGKTYDILEVKNGKVKWKGLPLGWNDGE